MKYIAIDTSGKTLTVIAVNGDREDVFFDPECNLNHSITLMPALEIIAKKVNLDIKETDFFVCTLGAGSFTGIRIGVSTVKALCYAFNKPCLPLTTFDAIAYNRQDEKVLAVINAKHGHYYVAGYDKTKMVISPEYISEEDVKKLSAEYSVLSFEEIPVENSTAVMLAEGIKNYVRKNFDKVSSDLSCLTPVYVRKSQAEEGR